MRVIRRGISNGYGGMWGEIWVQVGCCEVCDAEGVPVIRADTSRGEFYAPGVCLPCATRALEEPVGEEVGE